MARKTHLVVIDPQRSFAADVEETQQKVIHDGELCVPGAWEDMERLAAMIDRVGDSIRQIHVTMDSHNWLHIAHPIWFRTTSGRHPEPFTSMRNQKGTIIGSIFDAAGQHQDVGEFTTTNPRELRYTLDYLAKLEMGKRYPHMVWPPHCIIGTPGHNFCEPFAEAMIGWERKKMTFANKVTKGSNPWCEHFSAVQAEVPHPKDPTTGLNVEFIQRVMEADEILLAGEALSHCLANTVRDMANHFQMSDDDLIKKCVLLTDAASNVVPLEHLGEAFVKEMTARGMKTTTTVDYM